VPVAAAEPKVVAVLDVQDHKAAAAVGPAAAMLNAPVAVAACADSFAGVAGSTVAVGSSVPRFLSILNYCYHKCSV
jgi:hypothetical protein